MTHKAGKTTVEFVKTPGSDPRGDSEPEGCPVCDWSGSVATTHDRTHRYYTHMVYKDGEVLKGKTCSMRTEPKREGILSRLLP